MLDFVNYGKNSKGKLFPKFIYKKHYKDLMIKGSDFMCFYNEETGFWSTDEHDLIPIIDNELDKIAEKEGLGKQDILYLRDSTNHQWDEMRTYFKHQKDRYKNLDRNIIFNNEEVKRESYATFKLPYNMEEAAIPAWDEIMSTLYPPEERAKIEWAIGAVINGDSKHIQKFIVMYGDPGSGKGTVLKVIQKLFEGYWETFSCDALGNSSNSFSLEQFKSNPLVGIDPDGDLSKLNINTRLNTVISHEPMTINEKFKSQYTMTIDTFLFVATNNPVKITDSKSGLIRRLIDVYPEGEKIPYKRYMELKKQVMFECGGIAHHCLKVYKEMGEDYYNDYEPTRMIYLTDDIKSYLTENFDRIAKNDYIVYKDEWNSYKDWCEFNNIKAVNGKEFKKNINDYFVEHLNEKRINGAKEYNVFTGFKKHKFKGCVYSKLIDDEQVEMVIEDSALPDWLDLRKLKVGEQSKLDIILNDSKARKADHHGKPDGNWDSCTTKLKDIKTSNLHYVIPNDEHHIFIDFDIPGEDGKKNRDMNLKAASEFPPTYAEVSKSGQGLHLHYIYDGNIRDLSCIFGPNIEVKVFPSDKKSAIRRKLSLTNNLDIAHISSGLPLKKDNEKESKKMIDWSEMKDDKKLRAMLLRCMRKEYSGGHTTTNVSLAKKILDDCYAGGASYDVSDMKPLMIDFASGSTNQATKCLELVADMKFCSKDYEAIEPDPKMFERSVDYGDAPIVFFDVEVFKNLFIICYKFKGKPEVIRMINPTPEEVKELFKFRLVGFNNLGYDNDICYARAMGTSIRGLYDLSHRIINGSPEEKRQAHNPQAKKISYTDIYDFSNDKKSLKKWEIALGIHHLELGLKWDEEVPESLWNTVADYCCNDVVATEAVWDKLEDSDWVARIVLSELSGLSVNESTNSHTMQFIFGDNQHPQSEFIYTDLSKEFPGYTFNQFEPDRSKRSLYKGVYTKEGGWAHGEPGIWYNCALLDIASMHPSTAKALNIFGNKYTARYYGLVETRLHIKHGEIEEAKAMFDGVIGRIMEKYGFSIKKLDKALKVPINAVYGLTSASFPNRCRDPRNVDNIVAKRGALFMVNLREEVNKRGFEVAHVKTDSVKIPNATPEIIQFIMEYGKSYGYTFEHEATYEKMCLVNDAVYIAKYQTLEWCQEHYGYIPKDNKVAFEENHIWTATGTQFAVPYVFKTLFSHENIEFKDMCETKSVSGTGEIYICPEDGDEQYVGRVGLFCPMKTHGGALMRVDSENDKRGAVTGTKGYLWMESETVKKEGLENDIDISYYGRLCDEAIETIEKYGSFEEFVA